LERDPLSQILFIGSGRGLETAVLGKGRYAYQAISAASWHGKKVRGKIRSLLQIPRSLWQAGREIRRFRPDIVLGMGGYASGPVVWTAWALGYRTAIHEQNAFPGLANRILGRFVDRIFLSFPDSAHRFPEKKTILTGNPVRRTMRPRPSDGSSGPRPEFTLLVFGGSQGAHRLNEAMIEALPHLSEKKGRWRIIHQTGERDLHEVQRGYEREGWAAEVKSFIEEMDRAYQAADLVLCRAGATTVFELMAMGKPAVLVPYPFAANDHQTLNAQVLVRAGAAVQIRNGNLTGRHLGETLRALAGDPERLRAMGRAAAALARPEAAREIVRGCYELIGRE